MIQLIRENRPYEDFLMASGPVNFDDPRVSFVAEFLMGQLTTRMEQGGEMPWPDPEAGLVQLTYTYVRDKIAPSTPETSCKLTWKASEVLSEHEGTDYAKANLFAALLRKNGIPTGFAYQYRRDGIDDTLVLHALNAVYLESLGGWLRLDTSYQPDSETGRSPLLSGLSGLYELSGIYEMSEVSSLSEQTEQEPSDPDAAVRPVQPECGEDDLPIIYAQPDRQLVRLFQNAVTLEDFWAKRPNRVSSDESADAASQHPTGTAANSDPDGDLLDLLYGDPDDEGSCEDGCGSCSGCGHSR